ncbi:MAG: hypothetical protein WBA23_07485, partial [Tunicatimonas sp.]
LVPLIANEQVLGRLEIASFTTFADHQIAFLETVGEAIAAEVAVVQINAHTEQLLIQSQQDAENLRAQEEELRQNTGFHELKPTGRFWGLPPVGMLEQVRQGDVHFVVRPFYLIITF